MTVRVAALPAPGRVGLSAAVELLKPITWFAPMWAFGCGVVSSGVPVSGQWPLVLAGVALAGPLVCGTSQAANDWYDRHVDAINEPHRPIPSGRLPGRTGLYIAVGWTGVSLLVAALLGPWAFGAALVGVALAVAPGRACYVPLGHEAAAPALSLDGAPPGVAQIPVADAFALLGPLFHDPGVMKAMHDAKAAMLTLERAGLRVSPSDDVMLICYAQEAGAHGHELHDLSMLHLSHHLPPLDAVTGTGRGRLPPAHVSPERMTAHVADAADVVLRLWSKLRPQLRETRSLAAYERVDRRLVPVLMRMEQAGVKVDEAELRRMSADFAIRMEKMEADIGAMIGRPLNLGSNKQLGEVLFDELKLPGGNGDGGAAGAEHLGQKLLGKLQRF